jgi:hypothetical protein
MAWIQTAFRLCSIVLVTLTLSMVYIILIIRLYQYLQVKIARDHKIILTNQGNVLSIFRLKVESPESRLQFKLFHKDIPLVETPLPPTPEPIPIEHPVTAGRREISDESGKGTPRGGSNLSATKAAEAGRDVSGKVGIVASLLGTLGNLIPGSLGNQLRSKAASIRSVQTSTLQTTQEPLRTQRKVTALKMDGSRITGTGPKPGTAAWATTDSIDYVHTPVHIRPQKEPGTVISGRPGGEYWAQTKEVGPGESLSLTLRIDSKGKRHLAGSFLYLIHSQQVSLESAKIEIPPVTSRGTVYIKPIAEWRYWLPTIVCGLAVVMTILSLSFYLVNS